MHDRERDLMRAFARGGNWTAASCCAAPGGSASAPPPRATCSTQAQTQALAADFDWQATKGKTVSLLLNKHPYTDAMVADLDAFKKLTGMDVKYDVFPEDVYFDKVGAALSSGSDPVRRVHDRRLPDLAVWPRRLDRRPERVHLRTRRKTKPNYNWDDVLPNLRAATAWSGVPFAQLGGDGAKQWAIPGASS